MVALAAAVKGGTLLGQKNVPMEGKGGTKSSRTSGTNKIGFSIKYSQTTALAKQRQVMSRRCKDLGTVLKEKLDMYEAFAFRPFLGNKTSITLVT